ncbi:MAG: helix-turn-helix domain-containing protein [Enterocloster sp.]
MLEARGILIGLISDSGKTKTRIAADLGMSRQSLDQYMRKDKRLRLDVFERILDSLGYELTVKKKPQ